ncbi:diaminopimelate decarboxylase [Chloroflexota bacterium]
MEGTSRLPLFPLTAGVNSRGTLVIGGCDTVALAAEFGTPLYVFDEIGLRRKCAEFKHEFGQRYADTRVIYACKAFVNRALAVILEAEGLGLDVVSGGELGIAQSAGLPPDRVYFHGNNKSAAEIRQALDWGVGRIVVDNFQELTLLDEIAGETGVSADILLRLSPAVDPHTHQYIATGVLDTKFGFPLASGEAAIAQAMSLSNLKLVGLHFHVGSLIPDSEPYRKAIEVVLNLAAGMKQRRGFELRELNVGGGFAVQYVMDCPVPPVAYYAEEITSQLAAKSRELEMTLPRLIIEPGRAIVGQAGVALYTVGVVKDIPGVRRYVSVDGGMADNIRPALYGSAYEAVLANKMLAPEGDKVTVAGRFCESGDILLRDFGLPSVSPGDVLAVPCCGAYCLPMASNYNAALKPAVVMVKEGKARLIRRREIPEDLTRCDLD